MSGLSKLASKFRQLYLNGKTVYRCNTKVLVSFCTLMSKKFMRAPHIFSRKCLIGSKSGPDQANIKKPVSDAVKFADI